MHRSPRIDLFLVLCVSFAISQGAFACPFCTALASSFHDRISQVDVIAIASCTATANEHAELPIYSFRIERDLHSADTATGEGNAPLLGRVVPTYSHRTYQRGDTAILFGIVADSNVDWTPSEPLSPLALEYARPILDWSESEPSKPRRKDSLAREDSDFHKLRLRHYWNHLESQDVWVRRDCYNALGRNVNQGIEIVVIGDQPCIGKKTTHPARYFHRTSSFYWALLGLCGSSKDGGFVRRAMLQQLRLRESNPLAKDTTGLDAAISTYILLGGESALEEVEREFFRNAKRHASERYAAITALRVHTEEFQAVSKDRICRAFALVLDDPDFADMVIPDLARLEDWSHISVLRDMYRAESGARFLRVPIIRYLRACPLPEAQLALAECRTLDPAAYRRAGSIFPQSRPSDDGL